MQDAVDPPLVLLSLSKDLFDRVPRSVPPCICTNQQSSTHTGRVSLATFSAICRVVSVAQRVEQWWLASSANLYHVKTLLSTSRSGICSCVPSPPNFPTKSLSFSSALIHSTSVQLRARLTTIQRTLAKRRGAVNGVGPLG